MFTRDNTTGYTDAQLGRLNKVLAERLDGADDDDRAQIESEFSDEIARGYRDRAGWAAHEIFPRDRSRRTE